MVYPLRSRYGSPRSRARVGASGARGLEGVALGRDSALGGGGGGLASAERFIRCALAKGHPVRKGAVGDSREDARREGEEGR